MKIRCTIPNASEEINGIPFSTQEDGSVVSVDDVPDDVAAALLTIAGYEAVEGGDATKQPAATKPAKADKKAAEGQGADGAAG